MNAGVFGAVDALRMVRSRVDVSGIHAQTKRPFRIFLCGDPALVAEMRALLLRSDEPIPFDAAATLETLDPSRPSVLDERARCIVMLRSSHSVPAELGSLLALALPVLSITVDSDLGVTGPAHAPAPSTVGDYSVPSLDSHVLRTRVFAHIVDCCSGIEVAVAQRLPALRESCCAKLTRDAARRALTVAAASAVVDHVPLVGFVLGAVTSAGDMLAITGMQIALMVQVGACYGKEPSLQNVWELLPVVGGGFGWRALSRELSGFIPVAGIAIKGAIAYAGTIVVGEGVTFFYEHGRHMTAADAATLYEDTKATAVGFAKEMFSRLRRGGT